MNKVIIYTKPNCNMCNILKSKMTQNKIAFEESSDYTKLMARGIDMLPVVESEGETFWNFALAVEEIRTKGSEAFGN